MFGRNFVNEKIHFLIVPINSNDECEKNGSRKKMEKGKIQGAEEAKRGEVENKSERLLFKRKWNYVRPIKMLHNVKINNK